MIIVYGHLTNITFTNWTVYHKILATDKRIFFFVSITLLETTIINFMPNLIELGATITEGNKIIINTCI